MSNIPLPDGIEVRGGSIRIVFRYKGKRYRETLKHLKLTKANVKFAANKRAALLHEIAMGAFDFSEHFPHSKYAQQKSSVTQNKTVRELLDEWLEIKKSNTAYSSWTSYEAKIRAHIRPRFGDLLVQNITEADIQRWVSVDLKKLANKTINQLLIILRGVFKLAKADKMISSSPLEDFENLKVIHPDDPDPFTQAEIKTIIATKTKRTQEINMIEFGVWSGLRLSELIALGWDDIDLVAGKIKVKRAKVKGFYKVPKTSKSERDVELLVQATKALKKQIPYTYNMDAIPIEVMQRDNKTIKIYQFRPVFLNTNTGESHRDDNAVRDKFFKHHLKQAKVRYRGPNHCRHTFISQMLTIGMPKEWISKQCGTSVRMIEQHYGKWIAEDAPNMAFIASKRLGFNGDGLKEKNQNDKEKSEFSEEELFIRKKMG